MKAILSFSIKNVFALFWFAFSFWVVLWAEKSFEFSNEIAQVISFPVESFSVSWIQIAVFAILFWPVFILSSMGRKSSKKTDLHSSHGEMKLTQSSFDSSEIVQEDSLGDESKLRRAELALQMYRLGRTQVDPKVIHDEFEALLLNYFPHDSGAISLYNPKESVLESVLKWGDETIISQNYRPEMCESFSSGTNEFKCNDFPNHINKALVGILFQVPLTFKGNYIGVLTLFNSVKEPLLAKKKEKFWKVASKRLADALSVQVLTLPGFERFQSFNTRDDSTSLFNRLYMEESLEREVAAAKRKGTPIGVMKVKVDHFSGLEKKYGAHVCERLMWEMGTKLPLFIRTEDIPSRSEKDTFVVILPGASLAISLDRAEKLRLEIEQNSFFVEGAFIKVSVSVGVCAMTDHGSKGSILLSKASAIVKQIQARGGNMVGSPKTNTPMNYVPNKPKISTEGFKIEKQETRFVKSEKPVISTSSVTIKESDELISTRSLTFAEKPDVEKIETVKAFNFTGM